jgi:hypothetical protein
LAQRNGKAPRIPQVLCALLEKARQKFKATKPGKHAVPIFNRQSNPVAVHLHDRVPVVGQGQEQPPTLSNNR